MAKDAKTGKFKSVKSINERFNEKFIPEPNTGCWLWTGSLTGPIKHGSIYYNGRSEFAHRISYRLFIGPIPYGLEICHHCDVPSCVNPAHLYAGTHQQNMDDRERRGRGVRQYGVNHPKSKLTPEAVIEIRNGLRTKEAMAKYGVCRTTIKNVRNNKIWKD